MLNLQSPFFLRRVLLADAGSCVAAGLLMVFDADLLAAWFGLPAALLQFAGALLLPFAAMLAFLATRRQPARAAVWVVIVSNLLWAVDSVLLLWSGWVAPTALGEAFVLAQAGLVALFAELEFLALRKAPVAVLA